MRVAEKNAIKDINVPGVKVMDGVLIIPGSLRSFVIFDEDAPKQNKTT